MAKTFPFDVGIVAAALLWFSVAHGQSAIPDQHPSPEERARDMADETQARRMIKAQLDGIPKGLAKRWEGCWAGKDLDDEPPDSRNAGEFCLKNNGDQIDVSISWPARGIECSLSGGQTRLNENGIALFFSGANFLKCSGKSNVSYLPPSRADGLCRDFAKERMRCGVTIFLLGGRPLVISEGGADNPIVLNFDLEVQRK